MKAIFFFFFFIFLAGQIHSQDYFSRREGETVREFSERYLDALKNNDTNGMQYHLMHEALEIAFGMNKQKKIVMLIQSECITRVHLLQPVETNEYSVSVFGEISYGFPNMDEILSVFAFDRDENGVKELFVLGKGGERDVNEDGLNGCCVDIYDCDIFEEKDSGFSEIGDYPDEIDLGSLRTATEIKAAFIRNDLHSRIKDISKDENLYSHLKLLDSVDKKHNLPVPRLIIDKIYELLLGDWAIRYKVVSFSRKTDSSLIYSVGLFAEDSISGFFYLESEKVHLGDVKNCKVESIFGYDADKWDDGKKELIVLLSVERDDNRELEYMPLVFNIYANGHRISHMESWRYGLHGEKNASEIKSAIEYYHQHKYDEKDEAPRD